MASMPVRICLCVFAVIALAGCTISSGSGATETAAAAETRIAADIRTQVSQENERVATNVAATVAALPSDTPIPTPTATSSATPTFTPPPSATPSPSPLPSLTLTRTPVPTVASPTPSPSPTSASIYQLTFDGPEGYVTFIDCTFAGGECQPIMPPGDLSFRMLVASAATAPLTRFDYFGLAVERDGVNIADMFMTAASGWLPPGAAGILSTSRNFSVPGRYVLRGSGCMQTDPGNPACEWRNLQGDRLVFTIR